MKPDSWILTVSGVRFELLEPTPAMVNIGDIAHALSQVCRFGGHTQDFYSVAQHSVLVSHHVPPYLALAALLHDATEAYLGDVVRPLKRELPDYKALEAELEGVIAVKFGVRIAHMKHIDVKLADERALQTERRDVMIASTHPWSKDEQRPAPYDDVIVPLPPRQAAIAFLERFQELYSRRALDRGAASV